ncbi:MAG: transcriptional regulator PpsR [Rubrivivax sp.]|nr:transcriptional regulator PpsR [Rubrivivax sp.]
MTRAANTPKAAASRLRDVDSEALQRVVHNAADVTLVLDGAGVVLEVTAQDKELLQAGARDWRGLTWAETVAPETRDKVAEMLQEAREKNGESTRWRQVNQRLSDGTDFPVLYSVALLTDDARSAGKRRLIALGRDQRPTMAMQQRLVEAQQAVERDYWRFREAETRYRKLFQTSTDAVLIVDSTSSKILEANPAATTLVRPAGGRIVGLSLPALFEPAAADPVQALLASARSVGKHQPLTVVLSGGNPVSVHATFVRQDESAFMIVRLAPMSAVAGEGARPAPARRSGGVVHSNGAPRGEDSLLASFMRASADALAFTDSQGRIVGVNRAFATLAQLSSEDQARGESLDRWLGRPGVELDMLITNLRQEGSLGLYATELRGEFGAVSEVEISASRLEGAGEAVYSFAVRDIGRRLRPEGSKPGPQMPASVHQLTELVGRVPLKQIVSETSDLIEQLSIQAALKLSRNNRALAAQLLGLSRQSLYVKLRRYGLGEVPAEAEE